MGAATTSPCPWGISCPTPGSAKTLAPPGKALPRSSPLSSLQHLVSLCVPDVLVLAQGALPDPLLALDADGVPSGDLNVGGGQLHIKRPCEQKALLYAGKHLQQEGPIAGHRPVSRAGICPLGEDRHPLEPCHCCTTRGTQCHKAVTLGTPNCLLPLGLGHPPGPDPPPVPHGRCWVPPQGLEQTTAPQFSPDSAAKPSCFAKTPSRFLRLSMKIWLALEPLRRTPSMRQRALSVRTTYRSCTSSTSCRFSTPWASRSSSKAEISGLLTRSTNSVRTFRSC